MDHRLSQVHGDFHPWNILFREGTDFTVLDRSRGEWGEPADDLTGLSINYLFYSIQEHGCLKGGFKDLFEVFFDTYTESAKDSEIFKVLQPFFAFRGLVVASPVWYPNLDDSVRTRLVNFIFNMLEIEEFEVGEVNSYLR